MGERVYARRPFDYGTKSLARGEVFELQGARNDEVLLRLRYVERVEKGARLHQHGASGRKFIEAGFLEAFGREEAHKERLRVEESFSPDGQPYGVVDTTGDAEEARLEREAPLALENTRASRR